MANLHAASSQWASRPADERFWNLADLKQACTIARNNSQVATVPITDLHVTNQGSDVTLVGKAGNQAKFTNYAFGQFCATVHAPASYLRQLPAPLAAECLNVGLSKVSEKSDRELLFHKNGGLTLRASLSNVYDRVWDDEVVGALERLHGWRTPAGLWVSKDQGEARIATEADILPGQINIHPGDQIAASGLYASDHDMFAILLAPDRVISDGKGGALLRGVIARNSEVGDSSLVFTFFLCQAVCGNHIIWGATGVHEIRVRHVGKNTLRKAFRGFEAELRKYHDAAPEEEAMIEAARKYVLGNTKEEVLNELVKYANTHSLPLSKERIEKGLTIAEQHEDWYGDPRTVWAAVAGLTHGSQETGYADDRNAVDRAASKLLRIAF
jgi:hypothetical protein